MNGPNLWGRGGLSSLFTSGDLVSILRVCHNTGSSQVRDSNSKGHKAFHKASHPVIFRHYLFVKGEIWATMERMEHSSTLGDPSLL